MVVALLWPCVSYGEKQEASDKQFREQIAPLLEKRCAGCHGAKKPKGNLRVDQLDLDFIHGRDTETWHDILDALNRGEMPPEDEPQLSDAQRQTLVNWITIRMTHAAHVKRATGGQGVLRRLTRYEYNNTMADLLGIPLDYSKDLPPEPYSEDGFTISDDDGDSEFDISDDDAIKSERPGRRLSVARYTIDL